MQLGDDTLSELPDDVRRPTYDRSALRPGIAHIGVGHFHRAHQARYLDDLFHRDTGHEWALLGVSLAPDPGATRDALVPQDGLYTLTEKSADGDWSSRVIGSIVEFVHAPDDPAAAIARLADPAIRIISLTITEGGYDIDDSTGEFVGRSAAVRADLDADVGVNSVFGLVLEVMRARRASGAGGVTVMSCDNMPGNGHVAEAAFLGFADRKDADVAGWMREHVSFPNSMVDRVVPGTVEADREYLRERFGLDDRWPVTCEPFRQWVLEDRFVAGRPPLERVGVEVVDDVVPYELMKLRMLNGSHQALCYFGTLLGGTYVHEAATDADIQTMLRRYLAEAAATLAPIEGQDFGEYAETVIERFSNPEIRDPLARICAETSDRIPKFVLPVIAARLEAGEPVDASAAIIASWARYAEGLDEQGRPFDIVDPLREQLVARAVRQGDEPLAFVQFREIFGDLADRPAFTEPYLRTLAALHDGGARAALVALG